jgi:hypothetical protein
MTRSTSTGPRASASCCESKGGVRSKNRVGPKIGAKVMDDGPKKFCTLILFSEHERGYYGLSFVSNTEILYMMGI